MATLENTKYCKEDQPWLFAEGCIKCHLDQLYAKTPSVKSIYNIGKYVFMSEPGVLGINDVFLTLPQPDSCDKNTVIPEENEM